MWPYKLFSPGFSYLVNFTVMKLQIFNNTPKIVLSTIYWKLFIGKNYIVPIWRALPSNQLRQILQRIIYYLLSIPSIKPMRSVPFSYLMKILWTGASGSNKLIEIRGSLRYLSRVWNSSTQNKFVSNAKLEVANFPFWGANLLSHVFISCQTRNF